MKMPRNLGPRDVESAIGRDGWVQIGQSGSHRQYKHPTKRQKVTIPFGSGTIYIGTLLNILKQAELTKDDFMGLLK